MRIMGGKVPELESASKFFIYRYLGSFSFDLPLKFGTIGNVLNSI
jgi:hypothetical protein